MESKKVGVPGEGSGRIVNATDFVAERSRVLVTKHATVQYNCVLECSSWEELYNHGSPCTVYFMILML